MRVESLTVRICDAEIKHALQNMELPQGLKVVDVKIASGMITLQLALPYNIKFHPVICLSNPTVQGAVVALRISGPLGLSLPDIVLSSIMPVLPPGADYLGRGLILIDLLQIYEGAFRSLDLEGISIEPCCITLHVACAEFDLESLPKAASLLQTITIDES